MTYKVLALKWRPTNFDQIIGQEHITKSLKNAIKFDRISHAFTFSGPRGVGKTTTARILAKELNIVDDIESSFDIIEMDAASNRGIDEIRSLRENVSIAPAHGKYKIYIIDEVHMLTKEAFNALLKTLEEPPEHVIFILATTDPYKMPSTVLSRTQRYDFRKLSIDDIKKQLTIILESENKKFDDQALTLIARKADGSMRDALGYLDQVMNYCRENINFEEVQKSLGIISDALYLDLFNSIYQNDVQNVTSIVDNVINGGGVAVINFISDFNIFLRTLLHCIIEENVIDENIKDWLEKNKNITQLDVIRIMELLMKLEVKIRFINHPDLALELLMIKLCKLESIANITSIIDRLDPDDITDNKVINDKVVTNKDPIPNETVNKDQIDLSETSSSNDIIKIKDEEVEANPSNSKQNNITNPDNINKDIIKDKKTNILDKDKVASMLTDIVNFIDEKNSKTAGFMNALEVIEVDSYNIKIKVNNISKFLYDTLLKDINLIKEAFNRCLNTEHQVVIVKGKELVRKNNQLRNDHVEDEHPLFMDAIEKFDGKIIR